jgi:hypothetical protein
MNYPDISRDPPRDPEIAEWLGAGSAEPVAPDRESLRAAILARAQLPLARLRMQPQWWEYAARWARPAVPLSLAASVALAFAIGTTAIPGAAPIPEAVAAALPPLEDVLTYSVPEAEYNLLVAGAGDTEALLSFSMQEMR